MTDPVNNPANVPDTDPNLANQDVSSGQSDWPGNNYNYNNYNVPQPEMLLAEWLADSRVFTKRNKEYYSSLAVIVLLVCLILFFAGQTLLIFVVLSFLFIAYVLSTVKAETVVHQITTYGVRYRGEKLFYWEQLGRMWARDNRGQFEIHIEAPTYLGQELILLPANATSPDPITAEEILEILALYLPYEEPIPSKVDRWVMWLQDKFPLE